MTKYLTNLEKNGPHYIKQKNSCFVLFFLIYAYFGRKTKRFGPSRYIEQKSCYKLDMS